MSVSNHVRADAGGDWVRGSADWDWRSASSIKNVGLGLSDYDCNHDTYIQILAYTERSGTSFKVVTKEGITSGCNGKHLSWSYASISTAQAYPRWGIRVCRSDPGNDTCYKSKVYTNPYY